MEAGSRSTSSQNRLYWGMAEPLKALIFDVDGTLADTEEMHRQAFNQMFTEEGLGWEWDRELYGELLAVTGGRERIRHYLETIGSDLLARPDLDDWIASLHRRKTQIYTARVDQGALPLRPGVARLIREAREAGLTLAIATTTSRENVDSLLVSTLGSDSPEWFLAIGTGECAPRKKPDPGVYQWVLERIGAKPEACLALEDSANGLRAARAAGIPTLITVSPYTRSDDFGGAEIVLDHLGEPEQPFQVLRGEGKGHTHADLPLLRRWHRQLAG